MWELSRRAVLAQETKIPRHTGRKSVALARYAQSLWGGSCCSRNMSRGYGTSYRSCTARRASLQHSDLSGGTGLIGHAGARGPLCNRCLQAPSPTQRRQVWSAEQPQAGPQQGAQGHPVSPRASLLLVLPQRTPGKNCTHLSWWHKVFFM